MVAAAILNYVDGAESSRNSEFNLETIQPVLQQLIQKEIEKRLEEQAGWTQGQASMCFYLALSTFVFGNIIGGKIQDQYNPKIAVFVGGGIFTAGILLSAFLIIPSPFLIYLTYGVMQGFGQGMIYTTII